MPISDYPRIAGMTGLLLPFAERVQSVKDKNEKRTAMKKLLDEVDEPVQYAYKAAGEVGDSTFIFCKRPGNRFFYEKALILLEWAGEDVRRLQQEAAKNVVKLAQNNQKLSWMQDCDEKIFLYPDLIMRVMSALRNEVPQKVENRQEDNKPPYKNEADWRTFAYQVKLALWSMFPQYLGSQD